MIEALVFTFLVLLITCLLVYGLYRSVKVASVTNDYGAITPMLLVIGVCAALMYLNVMLCYPHELEQYHLRNEAERVLWKQTLEVAKQQHIIREREITEIMKKLEEKHKK